jgi:hypothetical protein
MSGRRVDWLTVVLYTVFGGVGLAFVGWVLWRLALAVDWMAAALLAFVIAFGLLMVSFDLRGGRGEPVPETPAPDGNDAASTVPATKPARRGRPRKAKPAESPPAAPPTPTTSAADAPSRGPRNRAGRAPITEPPGKPRPRNRP